MASYVDHFLKSSKDLPNIIKDSLEGIQQLDHTVDAVSKRLDSDLAKVLTDEKSYKRKSSRAVDPSLRHMKYIIEDFTDRKTQLAINAYDIIDQHIRVVDEEIKLLETAIRLSGQNVPPPPVFGTNEAEKGKKKDTEMEPRYCICNMPNSGQMVQCDNDDCPIEWFHLECVGLKTRNIPARWYCSECSRKRRRTK